MTSFLACTFASPGFLYPVVGLARELQRRGHEVAFATNASGQATLEKSGFARIPRGARDGESFNVPHWHEPLAVAIDLKHIEHAMQQGPFDAILTHHLCLSALIAGECLGIPVGVLGPMSYLFAPTATPVQTISPDANGRLRWRLEESMESLNKVRALLHLEPATATPTDHPLLGDLFMLRTVPALEPLVDVLPRKVRLVGCCEWDPEDERAEDLGLGAWNALRSSFQAPEAPLVYVHHGRAFGGPSYWTQVVEALGSAHVQVAASVGRMDTSLGALPTNFYVGSHVPQGLVLPHAQLAVAGGHTSVALGCLTHGVPSVLIPFGVDTPENSERLVAAGCALQLDVHSITSEALRAAVENMLADAEAHRRSRWWAAHVREHASFEPAALAMEGLVSRQPAGAGTGQLN